jgi:hypothetical protein
VTTAGGASVLFRGESLSPLRNNERLSWITRFHRPGEGLWTKLVNSGDPYALTRLGLIDAVRTHVALPERFEKTHFLSFTSDESVALRYAREPAPEDPEEIDKSGRPDEGWAYTRYAVFRLRIDARAPFAAGLYRLNYSAGANLAVLINASEYLAALPAGQRKGEAFAKTMSFAKGDNEWLVLPADPLGDGTLSALLRKSTELDVDHYVEPGFFLDGDSAFLTQ